MSSSASFALTEGSLWSKESVVPPCFLSEERDESPSYHDLKHHLNLISNLISLKSMTLIKCQFYHLNLTFIPDKCFGLAFGLGLLRGLSLLTIRLFLSLDGKLPLSVCWLMIETHSSMIVMRGLSELCSSSKLTFNVPKRCQFILF